MLARVLARTERSAQAKDVLKQMIEKYPSHAVAKPARDYLLTIK